MFLSTGKMCVQNFIIVLTFFFCCLVNSYCAPKKQVEPDNSKQNTNNVVELRKTSIDKSRLLGIWGTTPSENAAFQIQGDTIYYPDANRRLRYAIFNNQIVCFDEKGDTNFSCTIFKLDKDSLVMEDNSTKEKTGFLRLH